MRLFEFVEEQRAAGQPVQRESESATLAEFSSKQDRQALLSLILGHVESGHAVGTEQILRESQRHLGLADPGRAKEQEAPPRT